MTARSVDHASFTLERVYAAAPARVYAAWVDPAEKRRWFASGDGFGEVNHSLDVRVGGSETAAGISPRGQRFTNDTVFHDVVPNERLVFAYRMTVEGAPISVSLATVEFRPAGKGTRLVFTEQAAFLDGYDCAAAREEGWNWLLDRLARELHTSLPAADTGATRGS